MTVESATVISELDDTLPEGGNFISEGDNHLRLLKAVLQATFPVADRPFYFPDTVDYSASVSLTAAQVNRLVRVNAAAGQRTITLPGAGTLEPGDSFDIIKMDDSINSVNVNPASGTIEGQAQIILSLQYQRVRVTWSGAAWNTDHRNVGLMLAQRAITAAATLNYTAYNRLHYVGSGTSDFTINLPTAVGFDGMTLGFRHVATSGAEITLDASGSQTIDGALTFVLTQNKETIWLIAYGGNWRAFNYSAGSFSPGTANTWTEVQTLSEASLIESEQTLSIDLGDVDWDLALGNHAKLTVTTDAEFNSPSNKVVGQTGLLRLSCTIDSDLTWNAHFVWLSPVAATITSGDILVFRYFVASSTVIYIWSEVVDTNSAAYTDYELADPPAADATYTQAHGLAALPSNVKLFLKCTTAAGSFAVDDYLAVDSLIARSDGGNGSAPIATVKMNTTNVVVYMCDDTTYGEVRVAWGDSGNETLSFANFALILRVFS